MLLAGTPWESPLSIRHSGKAGPVALVLGGVHGNEPGGWQAALDVATWQPAAGSLIVLPRANRLAINAFVRTFDDIGDLNRLYPGNPNSEFAMERMAGAIVGIATEFHADLLLDMHESWQFYVDAPGTGTAALGQTVTGGVGPANPGLVQSVVAGVNPGITAREAFILRDGSPFARATSTPGAGGTGRGRSSLSVGGFVPGLTPVLVEMGQQGQEIPRRVELHLIVAQTMLQVLGVL